MYLAAQSLRSRQGVEAIHVFLHLHDGPAGFPDDPLSVPRKFPGRLVHKRIQIPPGGNSILSYLDVIAADQAWAEHPTEYWRRDLEPIGELMRERPLPWAVEAGDVHVLFNAALVIDDVAAEYETLLYEALSLSAEWRNETYG
jgi:hypothetical protein